MVGFEATIGWFHSALAVDGASIFSGFVVLLRGLVLLAASAVVVAPSAMEHVRINGQQLASHSGVASPRAGDELKPIRDE